MTDTRTAAGSSSNDLGSSGNRNVNNRFNSNRFDANEGSSRSSSRSNGQGTRTSIYNDRPGLFRPISTEFNDRSQFNSNLDRQSGSFDSSATSRGTAGNSDRFNTGGTRNNPFGIGSSNRFQTSNSGRFDSTRNDRFGSDVRNQGSSFGTGRFSSTSTGGTGVESNLFGITSNFGSGAGSFGTSDKNSFGSSSSGSGSAGGLSTSNLGMMLGEGSY